ncbi:MAG TPA: hypothetical protein VMV81_05880 [Phycisphaerae bacterium]|nr:hypothetical protein [Phycisphaerae bacterium]
MFPRLTAILLLATLCGCEKNGPTVVQSTQDTTAPAPSSADTGWPRIFEKKGEQVSLFQPQIDEWKDASKIEFRMAVALKLRDRQDSIFGALTVKGDTLVDHDQNLVIITNLDPKVHFPSVSGSEEKRLEKIVGEVLPKKDYLQVSLDRVLACLHADQKPRVANINLDPPPIFHSESPAILVIFMGSPQFKPIKGTKLLSAVNTNWPVFLDESGGKYFLLDQATWLTAPDAVKGPWTAATSLPREFSRLPKDAVWDEVHKHIPLVAASSAPRVFTSTEPAELIVTNGPASYTPISGTSLLYVSNPVMPLFMNTSDSSLYLLVAGRWFRATGLDGPWTAASTSLPSDFSRIPSDSPVGDVLASVPGTTEANAAIAKAAIPHIASLKRDSAKLKVVYEGPPKFVSIPGTSMSYAVNTSNEVILVEGNYYCCNQGAWFVAPAATGPWLLCVSVPQTIYTIPPTSPMYNVTYVQVYNSTPTTVTYGYTSGYSGEYLAATGTLMFGAGMATGALLASSSNYCYPCSAAFCSYGCAAAYHYGYGGYYRACGCYGPYGGAGHYAAYNPATGAFSRGSYHYGPYGASEMHQAYNPFTGVSRAHASATNGYQSWGHSVASRGDQWASASHVSGEHGSAGWAHTSSGASAGYAHAGDTTVAKTPNNVYASHDGNVYRKPEGGGDWQHFGEGGWHPASGSSGWDRGMEQRMNDDFASRFRGDSMANRFGGFGGGGFDRGGFGGRGFGGGGFGGRGFGGGGFRGGFRR